jgi:chemotaxis protein methyltransferase WspC
MMTEFEAILKRTMGLDAASIGLPAVERAVQERMAANRCTRPEAYLERLQTSRDELQALIEAVVVPETWFFRDREAFAALAGTVYSEWSRGHADGMMRILSLPCSTGEEPYSMAMALLDGGVPPDRFRVDAVDISARSVALAQAAVYGKNSFRGEDLGYRERHFEAADPRSWRLKAAVTRQVEFQTGNLFEADFLPGAARFDVIFCRNVLIYFDRPMQDRAVGVLRRLLAPQGFLFVGPSETGLLLSHDFDPAKLPLAFAFRKGGVAARAAGAPAPASWVPAVRATPRAAPRPVVRPLPFQAVKHPAGANPKADAGEAAAGLDAVAALADQGHFVEAAKRGEEHLRAHGPTARAFYLLGLVRDAAGNHGAAIEYYRKALYLEPKHREALLQLAYLLEKQGDRPGAKVLNERARRIGQEAAV